MSHPRDRSRINRRQFVRLAAGSAVGLGAAGALAGCENTTAPIGASSGGLSGEAATLVVGKPTGPGGLPLPRPDNAVTWAITETNKPIADGRPPERGPLNVYNYADYIDPALIKRFEKQYSTSVQIATYNSADEAIAKLASGAVAFDVIIGLTGSNIVDLIAQRLLQPLNHSYLPNLAKNIWPRAPGPVLRPGQPLHGAVHRLERRHRLAQRQGEGRHPGHAESRGTSSGTRRRTAGEVGILDDKRDALSMPLQRDAMRTGARPDLNTESADARSTTPRPSSRSSTRSATRR